MSTIKQFFSSISYGFFNRKTRNEIYRYIFPQLNGETDAGYPFTSYEEILKYCEGTGQTETPLAKEMEPMIQALPTGFGFAFRYMLYRELDRHHGALPPDLVRRYKLFAQKNKDHN